MRTTPYRTSTLVIQPRRWGRILASMVVVLASACTLFYVLFVSPSSGSLPSGGADFLASSLESENFQLPRDRSQEYLENREEQRGYIQEIVDVTSQGESLFSLFYANLLEEGPAREAATALAAVIREAQKESLESEKKSSEHRKKPFDAYSTLKAGRRYSLILDREGKLQRATIEIDPANVFHASWEDGKIRCWKEEVVLDYRVESLTFVLQGTLEESLRRVGEGLELASELINVFRFDINFRSDVVKGDVCRVVFERRLADDRPSGYGRVLAAVYEGKKVGRKTALFFKDRYYDYQGIELKKDFLRSPLSGTLRVTSKFGQRLHPIYQEVRRHDGVDYGAPIGTPVLAIANGVVVFAGWRGGYGNLVCIRHDRGTESRYGHLQRMFVKTGSRVKQGERIGLVGMTGDATGPHLHFEYVQNGKPADPQRQKLVQKPPSVPEPLRTRFLEVKEERIARLEKPTVGVKMAAEGY